MRYQKPYTRAGFIDRLRIAWAEVEGRHVRTKRFFFLSPTHFLAYHDCFPFFKKYIKGLTLDIGAGRLVWKTLVEKNGAKYISCDIKPESKDLSFITDATHISVREESLDTVICMAVLEHTRNPGEILKGIGRILKKDGYAIVSFPHLSFIHGAPEDYFRYTIYGFESLLPDNLTMEDFKEIGGIICFVMTPIFIAIHSVFHRVFILRDIVFFILSALSIIVFYLDRIFGLRKVCPAGYIVCLRKR